MKLAKKYEVEKLVGRDTIYPKLMSPAYEPEKRRLVISNRHALAVVPVAVDAGEVGGHVPVEALKHERKNTKGKAPVSLGAPAINIVQTSDGTAFPREEGGVVVNPDQLIPWYRPWDKEVVTISLDAGLLANLARALGAEEHYGMVHLTVPRESDGSDPIVVTVGSQRQIDTGEAEAVGLIMPQVKT